MPTLSRKNARPLLKVVRGQPHATHKDHEETETSRESGAKLDNNSMQEEDISAEPLSSSDELTVPAPRQPPPKIPKIPSPVSEADTVLKIPQKKPSRKKIKIQPPIHGAYERGRAEKAKRTITDNKENAISTESTTATAIENTWMFDKSELPASKKQKTQRKQYGAKNKNVSTHRNIHAQPLGPPGKASSKEGPKTKNGKVNEVNSSIDSMDEDDASDVSMVSLKEPILALPKVKDSELHTKENKRKAPKPNDKSKSTALDDVELTKLLDERAKAPRLIHQLGDWVQGQASSHSQSTSSAPEESLHNIDEYIEQLPQFVDEDALCGLCKEAVDVKDSWTFWKGKTKSVKNQTAFCNMHKRKSAQVEYEKEAYPTIDWTKLPKRIRKHRTALLEVFNNDRPSDHRERYEPLALTGKAAAVPTKRKDLPESIQEELESYALDDQFTYPGYYGPRGRRLITENVMKVLKNEIKNCNDAVVQGSGPAAFIQAVIVPETAILLIMEDCQVGREEAEAIREKTYEMGVLLNEEIEDQIEAQLSNDDDDVGNEYHDS